MNLLDLTLPTLAENLALDEALLLHAEAGGPTWLRFWTWPNLAVVLGAGGKATDEAHLERCYLDNVPVLRRGSGGGTVLLGPGCLLYSLILTMNDPPALSDLHASYRFILDRTVHALAGDLPGVAWSGTSDLVLDNRKFSGNAQQRKRTHLLHHGTLLHGFDLTQIDRYLKHPPRMPDYRQNRPHDDFVRNLDLSESRLKLLLRQAWNAEEKATPWPQDVMDRLLEEKYAQPAWHERR